MRGNMRNINNQVYIRNMSGAVAVYAITNNANLKYIFILQIFVWQSFKASIVNAAHWKANFDVPEKKRKINIPMPRVATSKVVQMGGGG